MPQIIREHMGGRTTALLRFLLRATKFMHRDGYSVLSARLRGLQWDMGAGFESQLELGHDEVGVGTACLPACLCASLLHVRHALLALQCLCTLLCSPIMPTFSSVCSQG